MEGKLYVKSKDGYAVIDENNICKIFVNQSIIQTAGKYTPNVAAWTVKNTIGGFFGYTPSDAAQDLKHAEGTVLLKYDGSIKTINNTFYFGAVR